MLMWVCFSGFQVLRAPQYIDLVLSDFCEGGRASWVSDRDAYYQIFVQTFFKFRGTLDD